MAKKIVAMPQIPGSISRGTHTRSDLTYAKYGEATWRWWCQRHGIDFVVLDKPLGDGWHAQMPPTFQRWLAPELLLREQSDDARIALVDADTMIRWDAPDFFDQAQGFAAVRGTDTAWIIRSVDAFQKLFPDISLPWWEYFNAGFVVLGKAQLEAIAAFLSFASDRWGKISAVAKSGNFGTDQTPLNFMLRLTKEPIHFLPASFNVLHCFPLDPLLAAIEADTRPNWEVFSKRAFSKPGAFDFCDSGYVWHFSNVVAARSLVMRTTWERVRKYYVGANFDRIA